MGVLTFIIVLGVLIAVHEFGHFIMAKRAGVGVETFSIGFGPKLIAFTRGETEYRISAIPLGGYVKMVGDNPGEDNAGNHKAFNARPVRDRMPIVLAGPVVNLALAFMLMPVVYMIGVQVPAFLQERPVVGFVVPESPAEEVGIQVRDEIVLVNNQPVQNWEELLMGTLMEPNRRIEVQLLRDGESLTKSVVLGMEDSGAAFFGVQPPAPAVIAVVSAGSPAAEAGLQPGDEIIAIDGEPVPHWITMAEHIQNAGERPLEVTFLRDGAEHTAAMTPMVDEASGRAIIGIQRAENFNLQKYGFVDAVQEGVGRMVQMTTMTFEILGRLVTGQLTVKALGGPVRIAQVTSAAAESGFVDVLALMAFLSLQLGILNLLPIPVLDGGHVMFMTIEAIRRRPVSRKAMEVSTQVGFVLLILLMVVVTKNDIIYAWGAEIERFVEAVRNRF
jgi:regulator of sigma E protease